ncbi:hypothetical protein OIU77_020213 [Salix suchowensis]|uniref:Uncharacterized protein n=1 Tax=Salix suchowensis TaxID=1278906 RepID=A0ABQ9CN17_9ROSI|nr:hypothetical protein OIU77_020213 [Salix suchowensis]
MAKHRDDMCLSDQFHDRINNLLLILNAWSSLISHNHLCITWASNSFIIKLFIRSLSFLFKKDQIGLAQ